MQGNFSLILAAVAVIAVLLGIAIGWMLGGRPVAEARAERDEAETATAALEEKFRTAIVDLATALQRAETAEAQRDVLAGQVAQLAERAEMLRNEREVLNADNAALKADASNHEKQLRQLTEAKEALAAQFSEVGGKLLGEAQRSFLDIADRRFAQSEEKSEARLRTLLDPVGEKLKAYEESVRRVEDERKTAYSGVLATIEQVRLGQDRVQMEAARLGNSLRNAPKARGRWGEQQLRNVLEICGLAEHTDFVMESSVSTEEGRLRPDAIISMPGGQSLVVDAKVSLNAYQDAFEADDDAKRQLALDAHCRSMKAHIDGLSRKAYWDQFAEAPDYVIMFIPGEHFLSAALENDNELWNFAFEKKVLLATPTNLVAIARTVAGVWRQEKMAAEAKQIGALGKDMYDRLAVAGEHLKKMGGGLANAVGHYNKFVGSFERNVMSTGRKFAALNIETGNKELDAVPEVDALPRYGDALLDTAEHDVAEQG